VVAVVVVPVLTLLDNSGRIDRRACAAYAARARESWVDLFLVSGSLGGGSMLSRQARRDLLTVWLDEVGPARLVACGWEAGELEEIGELGVRPVAVLRELRDEVAVIKAFEKLPAGSFVYSHPQYTRATLTPAVAEKARADGFLPAGAKVSKVSLDEVRTLRAAAGPEFALFDGRCRHLAASVEAGATGVVAVPLSVIPADLPPRDDLDGVQAVIDRYQAVVDAEPDVAAQAAALTRILTADL
jgi:dihydrodipicolinate synthase/N-acetylneuraminate lyase